ncbi:MAG: hypothetical protein ACK2UO_13645, partial [Caldilineaceae bacterium]
PQMIALWILGNSNNMRTRVANVDKPGRVTNGDDGGPARRRAEVQTYCMLDDAYTSSGCSNLMCADVNSETADRMTPGW